MNKIMLAVPVFFICSYFVAPIQTAEASEHRSVHKASKHSSAATHKANHQSDNHPSTSFLVWPQVPRQKNGQRSKIRHVCHDCRPQNTTFVVLRQGYQPEKPPQRYCSHQ